MKRANVTYAEDGDGRRWPVLFGNATMLYWAKLAGRQPEDLVSEEALEMSAYEQAQLYYASLLHGSKQVGKKFPYSEMDVIDTVFSDDVFAQNLVDEWQAQMFAKAEAMGVDPDEIEAALGMEKPKAQAKRQPRNGTGKRPKKKAS